MTLSMRFALLVTVTGATFVSLSRAEEKVPSAKLSENNFVAVQKLIKPQPGESLWRHVSWETSLITARKKAAEQGKPLLIWSGGGSAPLGGC